MSNKTCGECSWFSDNRCNLHNNQYIFGDRPACKDFKRKPTVFETITASPEVLAKKTVHPIVVTDLCTGNMRMCYYSPIVDQRYDNEAEAIAATVERLKEVEK